VLLKSAYCNAHAIKRNWINATPVNRRDNYTWVLINRRPMPDVACPPRDGGKHVEFSKRKLVFSIVLRSLLPILIQCNELIVIRTAKPSNDFYRTGDILCTRGAFMQTRARPSRAKSLISSGNHIVVYFVRRGIVRDWNSRFIAACPDALPEQRLEWCARKRVTFNLWLWHAVIKLML